MKMKHLIPVFALSAAVAAQLMADVTVTIAGGNATRNLLYDRATNLLGGPTAKITTVTNPTDKNNIRSISGTNSALAAGKITFNFYLEGASGGLSDLLNQIAVVDGGGNSVYPQLVVSAVFPETVGIDSSQFLNLDSTWGAGGGAPTVIVPAVYAKNSRLAGGIGAVTNLTQRNAAYLEAASGYLPAAYFGGSASATNIPQDAVYLVGRNTASAVRSLIDSGIYFSGAPAFWTVDSHNNPTNSAGLSSGSAVTNVLGVLTNAIGTLGVGDLVGNGTPASPDWTALSYEGVPFTTANVINGAYPIWGYENWWVLPSGPGSPSAAQQTVIQALYNAISDTTFQHSSSYFVGIFVAPGDLNVSRSTDGGPITSLLY